MTAWRFDLPAKGDQNAAFCFLTPRSETGGITERQHFGASRFFSRSFTDDQGRFQYDVLYGFFFAEDLREQLLGGDPAHVVFWL